MDTPSESGSEAVSVRSYEIAAKPDTHAFTIASLEISREQAWTIAHYERDQSDKVTSQIRFGLTAANAASLVTAFNIAHSLTGVSPNAVTWAAACFFLGTVLSGYSLISQQNRQLVKAGLAGARASTLDRAVGLSKYPPRSPEYTRLGEAMKEAGDHQLDLVKPSLLPIWLQHLGMGAWVGGVLAVGAPALAAVSPTVATLATRFAHLI